MSPLHGAKAVASHKPATGTAVSMSNMTLGSMMSEGMGTIMKTSAGSSAEKSVIGKIFTHPLTLFGLGVVAGRYIYKYRQSIIPASGKVR